MTRVLVRYYSVFCVATGFCREEVVELSSQPSVAELVEALAIKYGVDFQKKIFDGNGKLRFTAWVLVNGKRVDVSHFQQLLNDGDNIVITTPLLVGG